MSLARAGDAEQPFKIISPDALVALWAEETEQNRPCLALPATLSLALQEGEREADWTSTKEGKPGRRAPGYHSPVSYIVSTLLPTLDFLLPHAGAKEVHGANLSIWEFLRSVFTLTDAEKLEIFLPPALMTDREALSKAAGALLPPEMKGRGRLSFYPVHSIPETWSDGKPRILRTIDPEAMPRDRYLRDRFAVGPMALSIDTHLHGRHADWHNYASIARAQPVPFDSIVSLSKAHAQTTRKVFELMFGVPSPCRIDVLGRPVDLQRFGPVSAEEKRKIRKDLDWPPEGVIALYLARVTSYGKAELSSLVRAFSEVQDPQATLIIAGPEASPRATERIQGVGRECGLGHRLIVFGGIPPGERQKAFQAADLYVLPSDTIQEAYGVSALEAMASSLPVIVTDWDGFKDYVVDGETGYAIPTYWTPGLDRVSALSPASSELSDFLFTAQSICLDRSILANRLDSLISDKSLRAQMGEKAQSEAMKHSREAVWGGLASIWHEQLDEASLEPQEARERRRSQADAIGLPTPYLRLFDHYGTSTLRDSCQVRLSRYGQKMIDGEIPLGMYDDTVAITHGEVLRKLLEVLSTAGDRGLSLDELVAAGSNGSFFGRSDVLFHAALLIKADAIDVMRH